MKRFLLFLFLLAGLGGAGIYKALHPPPVVEPAPPSRPLLEPQTSPVPLGGPFELIDHHGKKRTEKSFANKYLIVYFGYSYCPDICPMALTTLSQVIEEMGPKAQKFQPLFITVDPKRDTVQNLALYAQNFHPHFLMLTGSPDKIKAACRAYRVYAAATKEKGSTEELIDHSSIIYVMNPSGEFVAHFNHTSSKEEIVCVLGGLT